MIENKYNEETSNITYQNDEYCTYRLLVSASTGNCQLAILGYVHDLLNSVSSADKIIEILLSAARVSSRQLLLMDINRVNFDKLSRILNDSSIILNTDYLSSNNSEMKILIINTALI